MPSTSLLDEYNVIFSFLYPIGIARPEGSTVDMASTILIVLVLPDTIQELGATDVVGRLVELYRR